MNTAACERSNKTSAGCCFKTSMFLSTESAHLRHLPAKTVMSPDSAGQQIWTLSQLRVFLGLVSGLLHVNL